MQTLKFLLLTAALFAFPIFLVAQKSAPKLAKFRITYLTDTLKTKKQVGSITQLNNQSLMLLKWGEENTLQLDVANIQKVQVYTREKPGLKFLLGLGLGFGAGYGLAKLTERDCSMPCDTGTGFRTAGFTASGAIVGMIVGGVFLPVKWKDVELSTLPHN